MAETMKQYMSKTRADYGSGVARPKIEDNDNFELKGQFLKELHTNTFSGSNHEDANEHIKKVLEIVDLFHILNITIDQEVILFYNGLGIPTRKILDSRGVIPSKTATDAKVAIQEMAEYSQKWHNGTSRSRNVAIQNQGASIKTLEIQIRQMSKALQERGFGSLPRSTEANPGDQVKSISTAIEVDSYPIRRIGSNQYVVSTGQNRALIYTQGYQSALDPQKTILSTAHAKIDVYKRKSTLRVKEEMIVFTSVKPASSLIKRVYMLSLREIMELDLEARLIGETLGLNRSLDPFFEDYIELNDLNKPFELRRNQGDDLMPTIEEKDKFYNSIMKDKMVYKGNNVIGALMNVPIFVGTFSIVTDFAVLENMDTYRDERMGDVIFGKPFLREVGIKTRRFEGMITIYNGDDEVTYQMVRSHPRFKHHTNEQCNKIPPLLKVREEDKNNGISHTYQKLKGFYKGVLNLGPDYIRDANMEK
ncbi:hypothetical protein Tco_1045322 [Tanacetum coccineum]|uniref:DNA-directed RNA polymerase n=1 Tax=Tanacetum coccineum TaxID=301880 RepID=A0ABQ5GUC1_9ASTR